jgi:hypothetical protein
MTAYKNTRGKGIRVGTIVIALAVVVAVIAVLAFYPSAPTSNTVYCGILQYVILPGKSVVSGKTITVTQTITTAIDYTTTTTPGPIGSTYSNSTTSTNTSGYSAGVETICKYISSTSSSK